MSLVDVNQFRRKVTASGSIASAVDSNAVYKLSPFHSLKNDTYVRKTEFKVKLQQSSERGVASISVPLFDDLDKNNIRESKLPYVHVAVVLIQISCLFDWSMTNGMEGTFALLDTLFDNVKDNIIRACNFKFVDGRAACCFRMNFSICAEDAMSGRPIVPYIKVLGANIRDGLRGFSVSVGTIYSLNRTEFPSVQLKVSNDFINIVGTDFLPKEKISELCYEEISESFSSQQQLPAPVTMTISRGRKEGVRLRDYSIRSSTCNLIKNGDHKKGEAGNNERGRRSVDYKIQGASASGAAVLGRSASFSSGIHLREHSSERGVRVNRMGGRRGFLRKVGKQHGLSHSKESRSGTPRGDQSGAEGSSFQLQSESAHSDSESDSAC
ncbi:movement protein [Cherry virus T]|uniref:Movement protein n=1 Tax=Cherry virus T TaxID=2763129 RepID=A0AAE7M248_9VIRU|nr:movement protein [Cherry virus T]QNG41876.1 movement protein [Cherry virus T]